MWAWPPLGGSETTMDVPYYTRVEWTPVSRNDQAQAGHEGESGAPTEFSIAIKRSGHQKDHPGRETRVIPCVVVGAHSRTHVCVFFLGGALKNIRTHQVEFLVLQCRLTVIHD